VNAILQGRGYANVSWYTIADGILRDRFVANEPLRRVHECTFGVLALERERSIPGFNRRVIEKLKLMCWILLTLMA
jgi:hypothetical protein